MDLWTNPYQKHLHSTAEIATQFNKLYSKLKDIKFQILGLNTQLKSLAGAKLNRKKM